MADHNALTLIAHGSNAKGERERGSMRVCPRCGIDFDASDFVPESPCRDCQWDYPDEEFRKFDIIQQQEQERKDRLLAQYTGGMNSDPEVAEMLGIPRETVMSWRKRNNVKPHQIREGAKYGYSRWRDYHAKDL